MATQLARVNFPTAIVTHFSLVNGAGCNCIRYMQHLHICTCLIPNCPSTGFCLSRCTGVFRFQRHIPPIQHLFHPKQIQYIIVQYLLPPDAVHSISSSSTSSGESASHLHPTPTCLQGHHQHVRMSIQFTFPTPVGIPSLTTKIPTGFAPRHARNLSSRVRSMCRRHDTHSFQ
ncbi:hypothetical protein BC832DRAFT_198209 [Gaertneriomyces semiglobifer]|nr:hypothetical protein BC832DRAFT_198209 [Gaertneriomyces semiglobifer]